ncbi:hypothetical protein GBA52_026466, partial [Prunus armeniaca]
MIQLSTASLLIILMKEKQDSGDGSWIGRFSCICLPHICISFSYLFYHYKRK